VKGVGGRLPIVIHGWYPSLVSDVHTVSCKLQCKKYAAYKDYWCNFQSDSYYLLHVPVSYAAPFSHATPDINLSKLYPLRLGLINELSKLCDLLLSRKYKSTSFVSCQHLLQPWFSHEIQRPPHPPFNLLFYSPFLPQSSFKPFHNT
jgi:hypothetical protein